MKLSLHDLLISIVNQVIYVPIRHHYICRDSFTFVERALQIRLFMQNKANFPDTQINVSYLLTTNYEQLTMNYVQKNKPNSNPNKANLLNAQINVSYLLTTNYEQLTMNYAQKNKPNTNPKQTQTKPIFRGVASGEDGSNPYCHKRTLASYRRIRLKLSSRRYFIEEKMRKQQVRKFICRIWKEWRYTILFIVFVVIPVKSSLADWNWVPTGSMNPTILQGDLIYVDKLAYDLRFPLTFYRLAEWSSPKRGDIVVCFSPEDQTRLVKRIIAVPSDTIESKGNMLFLNGRPAGYTEIDSKYSEYLSSELKDNCKFATENLDGFTHAVMSTPSVRAMRNFGPITVPAGHYFVMGDNRDNSRDSRHFGMVQREAIVGKARGVILSFDITDKYQPRLKRVFSSLK